MSYGERPVIRDVRARELQPGDVMGEGIRIYRVYRVPDSYAVVVTQGVPEPVEYLAPKSRYPIPMQRWRPENLWEKMYEADEWVRIIRDPAGTIYQDQWGKWTHSHSASKDGEVLSFTWSSQDESVPRERRLKGTVVS